MKNILLLGATGFLGRNLAEYLQRRPEAYALSTPSHRELDLTDEQNVADYLKWGRFDVVINAAICNHYRPGTPADADELEHDLRMFFHLQKRHGDYGKMLYFGSGAELNKDRPICLAREDQFSNGLPSSAYGLAKYAIGRSIEQSENIYNLRIFGLFGKYENWKKTFISNACCKALKGLPITIRQNLILDYLYVDDFLPVVEWFFHAVPRHHTYHVSSGRRTDLLDIAETVRERAGADVPIYVCKEGMGNEYSGDNARLLAECNCLNVSPLSQSVDQLLAYYSGILHEIDLLSLLYP